MTGNREVRLDAEQEQYVKDLVTCREIAKTVFDSENPPHEAVFTLHGLLGSPSEIDKELWAQAVECLQTAALACRRVFGSGQLDPDDFFSVLQDLYPDLFEEEEPEEVEPPKRARRSK